MTSGSGGSEAFKWEEAYTEGFNYITLQLIIN
jgi:hypothetical protein